MCAIYTIGVQSLPAIAQLRELRNKEAITQGWLGGVCASTDSFFFSCWVSCYWTDTTSPQ